MQNKNSQTALFGAGCFWHIEKIFHFTEGVLDTEVGYAGGVKSIEDLHKIDELSSGCLDVTVGSALDIFGGTGISYTECVEWNAR